MSASTHDSEIAPRCRLGTLPSTTLSRLFGKGHRSCAWFQLHKGQPSGDNPTHDRCITRSLDVPHRLIGRRVRQHDQFPAFLLAPTTGVAMRVPYQIDRTFSDGSPCECLCEI